MSDAKLTVIEQHYSDSVSVISSVKNSPANVIKILAAILNLASDRQDKYLASFWLLRMNIA